MWPVSRPHHWGLATTVTTPHRVWPVYTTICCGLGHTIFHRVEDVVVAISVLSRQTEAEQLASTCLLDWILLHRQHSGLSIFFQRWRLDAVGSCWISAFLAKLKMWLGIDSRTAAYVLIFCLGMLSLMTLTAWPWTLRERTWVRAFSSCVLCYLVSAFVAVCSFTNRLSVTVCKWDVSCQMCCISIWVLFISPWRFLTQKRSDISLKEGMPSPHLDLGITDISLTQLEVGSFIHFRMCSKHMESRFWSVQVDPKL